MDIDKIKDIANSIRDDYRQQANGTKRWLQDYIKETQTYKEYRGREIFELLQNADDAHSDKVDIQLDRPKHVLTVTNSGPETIAFTEDGIQSIMLSDLSPKKGKKLIGAKGLGFRSVLNWTNSIEIKSDNVSLRFGNDIVKKQWNDLKAKIINAEQCETDAKNDGREVPLAILALPEIREVPEVSNTTSIVLSYEDEFEQGIIDDLNKFQPESLLFLHSIKQVCISIDGEEREFSNRIIEKQNGLIKTELNGKHWIQAKAEGILSNEDDGYEVACAFCLDSPEDSYNIFSFFPTQVEFPVPCILHATLELDSSRNALLPGNKNNHLMMEKLSEQVSIIAEHLKLICHDWYPYRIMHPEPGKQYKNEYVNQFIEYVSSQSDDQAYIPTLNGVFVRENEYYYYTDDFYNLIRDGVGKDIFSNIRLNGAPQYANLNRPDPDIHNHVNDYAQRIVSDKEQLSDLIVSLLDSKIAFEDEKLHILRDSDSKIIEGHAYVNTGMEVDNIPSFRKIKYVDGDLVLELRNRLALTGKDADRDLVDRLKPLTNVSATDVSVVTRTLIPKSSDASLSQSQKEELLVCLYQLFIKRGTENFSKQDDVPYLMSESGGWVQSNTLVMIDKRFPDGFDKLGLSYQYEKQYCVMYPEFLDKVEGSTSSLIQDFLIALGVHPYFKTEMKFYGDDMDYLHQFNLPVDVMSNCRSWRVEKKKNSTRIADSNVLGKLTLQDLIKVLSVSSYTNDVCGCQQINWYLKCYKAPVTVDISYAAYQLRKHSKAQFLQYYAIEDDEWLPGAYLTDKPKFQLDYKTKNLLEKLGAKKHLSDFSAEELYDAVNQQEYQWQSPYVGAQAFYHTIKQALDSKDDSLSLPQGKSLRLLCKINDKYEFRDSRDIYYSDNNELPEDILKNLPMLVMRRREGEQMVKRLFGCKTLKDIKINILSCSENDILTRELNRHFEKLKPYILAFASSGIGRRSGLNTNILYNEEVKRLLTSFTINVVAGADYSYDLGSQNLSSVNSISMSEGELLCIEQKFYICAESSSLQAAMNIPEFNNAVIEALCIKLNLSSSDIANRFYRVFTSNNIDLEFYRKQEIEDSVWYECENQFGMADADVDFWKKVFGVNKIDFDEPKLRDEKVSYLLTALKIDLDRVSSPENFVLYHRQQLERIQAKYLPDYVWSIYNSIKDKPELHREYLQRQDPFKSGSWLDEILSEGDIKYRISLEYEQPMRDEMKLRFNYNPIPPLKISCPVKKDSYLQGIDEFTLNKESQSLLYFDGYDDFFNKLREMENKDMNTGLSSDEDTEYLLPITEFKMDAKNPNINKSGKTGFQSDRMPRKRNISNKRKVQLGNKAEKRVYEALSKDPHYEIGTIYSSYLSNYVSQASGDDSKGYDLEYRKEGDTLFRCLEIKYSDGESIILSENEYEVSQRSENIDRYDLALVTDNEIRIVRNAFANPENYNKIANDYTVYFTTTKV